MGMGCGNEMIWDVRDGPQPRSGSAGVLLVRSHNDFRRILINLAYCGAFVGIS